MKIFKNILISFSVVVTLIVFASLAFFNFCCEKVVVVGASMQQTLEEGQLGLYLHKNMLLSGLKRDDIIVFSKNINFQKKYIVKRIVGLPGEHLKIDTDGAIYINGSKIKQFYLEPYQYARTYRTKYEENMEVTLKDNEYYVLGDNRGNSQDSRAEGPIKEDQIVGKMILTYGKYKNFNSVTQEGEGKDYFPINWL